MHTRIAYLHTYLSASSAICTRTTGYMLFIKNRIGLLRNLCGCVMPTRRRALFRSVYSGADACPASRCYSVRSTHPDGMVERDSVTGRLNLRPLARMLVSSPLELTIRDKHPIRTSVIEELSEYLIGARQHVVSLFFPKPRRLTMRSRRTVPPLPTSQLRFATRWLRAVLARRMLAT